MILGKCRWCGKPLEQTLRGRDRTYCTTDCRKKYRDEMKIESAERRMELVRDD